MKYKLDIPAVSPVVGIAWLFVGIVYGILVRTGAVLYALFGGR